MSASDPTNMSSKSGEDQIDEEHEEDVRNVEIAKAKDGHIATGSAILDQGNIIPTTGERKVTTRLEYWSYCLWNWGGTGAGIYNYGSSLLQNLVEQKFPSGIMHWGGTKTQTTSFILDINGILFAVQLTVLLFVGPYADYGTWRPWLLIIWTIFGIGASFAFFGLTVPHDWALASGFFVAGNLALNLCAAFYQAAFPMLIRDLPEVIQSEREVLQGVKDAKDHATLDMLERSKLSNISLMFSALGSVFCCVIAIGICYGIGTSTIEQNTKVYSIIIGFFGVVWTITSLPWFIIEQHRPGQKLPDNTTWLSVGPKQVWEAMKHISHLKQTFLYLAGYFLMADVFNTSGTLVNILQNEAIQFDAVTFSGLITLVYGLEFLGLLINQWVQQRYKISPKWMFFTAACGIEFTNLWGFVGIWTDVIGYHHVWEFWFYQACIGFLASGWFSYGQTMMAEVSPAPKMYIFFSLYNTLGKTAAFIGPFITGAIINDAGGKDNQGFWFTFLTGLVALVLIAMVNPGKAKRDNARYLELERDELYASYGTQHPTSHTLHVDDV